MLRNSRCVPGLAAALALALAGTAAAEAPDGRERFPAAFFAASQPASALDMVARTPGFTFDGGDLDVRGLSGAAGNVLIDGRRPASKQDSLETLLRRIPAETVSAIELIRPGQGVDMQGRPVLANVLRAAASAVRGRLETELVVGRFGGAPRLAAEASRQAGDRLTELSFAAGREPDDEAGRGRLWRVGPDGALERIDLYRKDEAEDAVEGAFGQEGGFAGGRLRADLSLRRARTVSDTAQARLHPQAALARVQAEEVLQEGELGFGYDRALGPGWELEVRGLLHRARRTEAELEHEAGETSAAEQRALSGEGVLQGVFRRDGAALSLELGAEAALNTLESRSRLTVAGEPARLPGAEVTVAERRVEGFVAATWRLRDNLTLEAGARLEASRLRLAGERPSERAFLYPKPQLRVAWSPAGAGRLRLELLRTVGQLDFEDFASSASLDSDVVTAGNPDLEPDRAWRAVLAWERSLGSEGSIAVTVRRDWIEDVIDRVPVLGPEGLLDAVGNIGAGRRLQVEVDLKAPLDRFGAPGGLLTADLIWRDSEVTDPATGARRRISDEPAWEGALGFHQDLPAWRARWGGEVVLGETEYEFRFDEVERERVAARLSLFAEFRPLPGWSLRLSAENLTDGSVVRRRTQYDGLRGAAALRRVEIRRLQRGPFVGLSLRRSLGR